MRRSQQMPPALAETQSAGSYDEPSWSGPHKVKRVTGDQREGFPGCGL